MDERTLTLLGKLLDKREELIEKGEAALKGNNIKLGAECKAQIEGLRIASKIVKEHTI